MPARVVYLGDIEGIVQVLRSLEGVQLVGWIYERGDAVPVPVHKSDIPRMAVLNPIQIQDALEELSPLDLGVVSNFGLILSSENLAVPRLGFVNAHFGLLPENPGREPVMAAVRKGHKVTGVTLHRMTQAVDKGPVIDRAAVSVGTGGPQELFLRLSRLAGEVLARNLPLILS